MNQVRFAYVIKDTRNMRRDGKPEYVHHVAAVMTYDLAQALAFRRKRDAQVIANRWAKMMDYAEGTSWVSVVRVWDGQLANPPRI